MSNSPKLYTPAYELLQALYRPEQAKKTYEQMTPAEQEKTDYIMSILNARKSKIVTPSDCVLEESLPHSIVVEDCCVSEKIGEFLRFLGYRAQFIPASVSLGVSLPTLVAEW